MKNPAVGDMAIYNPNKAPIREKKLAQAVVFYSKELKAWEIDFNSLEIDKTTGCYAFRTFRSNIQIITPIQYTVFIIIGANEVTNVDKIMEEYAKDVLFE